MRFPIYHIDTLTQKVFSGNPAAVCILDEWLPDTTLQAIIFQSWLKNNFAFC